MKVKYQYRSGYTVKSQDTTKFSLINLENYDCKFVTIDVKTRENNKSIMSSVMLAVKDKKDIDVLIKELKKLKAKI